MTATVLAEQPAPFSFRGLAREFVLIAGGHSIAALGGLVGVRLLTQALTPTIYGEVALAMTLVLLAQQTLLSPLGVAFLRFFSVAHENRTMWAYSQAVLRLLVHVAVIVVILAVAGGIGLVGLGHVEWVGLVVAASALSLISGYSAALDNIQNAARYRALVVGHQVANQWVRPVVALALIWMIGKSSVIVMTAYALVSAAILCSQTMFVGRKLGALIGLERDTPGRAREMVASMRRYALPFATWGVFTWAFDASGRWALQLSSGTTDVGLYAALCQIGQYPIGLLADVIAITVAPVVFARAGDGSDQLRLKDAQRMNALVVGGMFTATLAATVVGYAFQDAIVALVVGHEYRAIAPLLPWGLLVGGLFGCAQVAVLRILVAADARALIAPKIVTALGGIVLKIVGAYALGLRGVIAASLLFSVAYLVWVMAVGNGRAARAEGRPRPRAGRGWRVILDEAAKVSTRGVNG